MIYLDMDGVLMDFERHCSTHLPPWCGRLYHHMRKGEWTAEEKVREGQVQAVMAQREFWQTMEPMSDAYILWSYCRPFNPHVLTATPSNQTYRARCAADKAASIRRYFDPVFPHEHFHACLRSEKMRFAVPGAVLVDDMPPNCQEWEKAGGTAILHKDAITTIRILQEIYHA